MNIDNGKSTVLEKTKHTSNDMKENDEILIEKNEECGSSKDVNSTSESFGVISDIKIKVESSASVDNSNTQNNCGDEKNSAVNEASVESRSTNHNVNVKKIDDLFFIDKRTPLEVIAMQYDSSDEETNDNEDTVSKKTSVSNVQDYRNRDVVVLSSDSSSDSESDSSSSSSETNSKSSNSDDSKNSNDESNDEIQSKNKNSRTRKNTQPKKEYDLPPIEDLQISVPEVLCEPLGKVAWFVKEMVVVKPEPDKLTLNLDTVLFIERGKRALGHIFDVFGQVSQPHYCVRFNSSEHIHERDIKEGMTVYFCPNSPYTSVVFLSELRKSKPVDDLEEDDPPQFSDDEEERAYLASLKNKSNKSTANQHKQAGEGEIPNKRRRGNKQQGWQSNHPWNSYRENQQLQQQLATRPFYRSHNLWSRPRYPQVNNWAWYQPLHPSQQQPPQFIQQANWASAYGPQSYEEAQQHEFGYSNPQQAATYYPQIDTNSYGQMQQQQPQANISPPVQDLSRLVSQYQLLTPPPPPPPPSDQNK
ncbi:H/ACA ribonucleoprotein complex non-core subunit NAF1 [Copidosoma floridanum]|uniref:H/ACA ribonucleoprotein complex non-core subunit NAF1 n=1 Tax=Copidosoma floridanum TaxID=29053 RepID=UPI0006C95B07|nr:H/ACA ribonucleoprotein complex non-core subunit NAF1 [Copidosoma floridanum]